MANWIGRTLSKVVIQRLLARGGMAELYLGRHTTLDRPVAVKLLRGQLSDDPELHERFRREARAVAGLRHPNIVQVFDFDVADDCPYMVMELIDGPSLADVLRSLRLAGRTLPPEQVARLATGIAAALDYAHTREIIHRDIKPGNVMLRREHGRLDPADPLPADAEPVLTDFGVMQMAGVGGHTLSGLVFGTPLYMSPEQARGAAVDARSDVYSLAAMLYEMLAGVPPFNPQNETANSLLLKHVTTAPPLLPGAPPALQMVLDRALAKNPDARFQSAGGLADEINNALLVVDSGRLPTLPLAAGGWGALAADPTAALGGFSMRHTGLLRRIDIFQGLDEALLRQVAGLLVEQRVAAGSTLFRQGDPGEVLYIVLAGRIKIFTRTSAGVEKLLAYNVEGSFFGEIALLTGAPRSASARAVTDSQLLVLTRADFDGVLAANTTLLRTMLQQIAGRQVQMNRQMAEAPAGGAPAPAGQIFVVYSPIGGAGTTTIATNLAVSLAQAHPDGVVLFDLSVPFGHAPGLLGLTVRSGLAALPAEALADLDGAALEAYLVSHRSTLRLGAGAVRVEDRQAISADQARRALLQLRRYFRYVVVDTSPLLAPAVLAAVRLAARTVLVGTPGRRARQDLAACERLFVEATGLPRERLLTVINHPLAASGAPGESILPGGSPFLLPHAGALPFAAADAGEPLVLRYPDAALAQGLRRLAHDLAALPATDPALSSAFARSPARGGVTAPLQFPALP